MLVAICITEQQKFLRVHPFFYLINTLIRHAVPQYALICRGIYSSQLLTHYSFQHREAFLSFPQSLLLKPPVLLTTT